MSRFFLSPDAWGECATLTGDEAKHAAQVLRARRGDQIVVFDGRGRSASAEIIDVSRAEVRLVLGETVEEKPLSPRICLAQAVPKGKTMDLIVQKAVELGVSSIQPLITKNTVVQVGGDDAAKKSAKWQRVALEACKQCGQNVLPSVEPVRTFDEWIGDQSGTKIMASLFPGSKPLRSILRSMETADELTFLIGPEGDFTEREGKVALEAGYEPVSLGSIILRAETAAFFVMSAARYEYPDG